MICMTPCFCFSEVAPWSFYPCDHWQRFPSAPLLNRCIWCSSNLPHKMMLTQSRSSSSAPAPAENPLQFHLYDYQGLTKVLLPFCLTDILQCLSHQHHQRAFLLWHTSHKADTARKLVQSEFFFHTCGSSWILQTYNTLYHAPHYW